ncbi:hypothetical protein BU26DRAFT_84814 [Trematosphaeria pertusa]|uniref:Uncharacterized protein n=1 Tax=Trematosphaeria pertusa TaxID=390896 RepID=A0A6A6I395_9PLEO|nr:uncharacterized protein BU26DRAFT_84814 [Trematosphaeria pertusa]KAF2244727.1 hypothetical protein BU26DRAFT_84814 [Trematosphaeria pertusa]
MRRGYGLGPIGTRLFPLHDGELTSQLRRTNLRSVQRPRDLAADYHIPTAAATTRGVRSGWATAASSVWRRRKLHRGTNPWTPPLRLEVKSNSSASQSILCTADALMGSRLGPTGERFLTATYPRISTVPALFTVRRPQRDKGTPRGRQSPPMLAPGMLRRHSRGLPSPRGRYLCGRHRFYSIVKQPGGGESTSTGVRFAAVIGLLEGC